MPGNQDAGHALPACDVILSIDAGKTQICDEPSRVWPTMFEVLKLPYTWPPVYQRTHRDVNVLFSWVADIANTPVEQRMIRELQITSAKMS